MTRIEVWEMVVENLRNQAGRGFGVIRGQEANLSGQVIRGGGSI